MQIICGLSGLLEWYSSSCWEVLQVVYGVDIFVQQEDCWKHFADSVCSSSENRRIVLNADSAEKRVNSIRNPRVTIAPIAETAGMHAPQMLSSLGSPEKVNPSKAYIYSTSWRIQYADTIKFQGI